MSPLETLARSSVVIVGFGVEGRDVYRFLRTRFPDKVLALADRHPLDAAAEALVAGDERLRRHIGSDHLRHVGDYELAFRSPGIPLAHPELARARARGTVFTSATALFLEICDRTVVGITGTKGKSTTSTLIHTILGAGGRETHLVGNIGPELGGVSPLSTLERAGNGAVFVYELSSFQLEGLARSPAVAVLLDVVPEHLDHHGGFEAYVAAKDNITRHQAASDWLVYDAASATASALAARSPARLMPCRNDGLLEPGCFVTAAGRVVCATTGQGEDVLSVDEILRVLPGRFNLRNALPAIAVGRILSVEPAAIARAVAAFEPLRYRFENLGTFRGVTFYDASIATVPEATIAHLAALAPRVGSVILGGVDRGVDCRALAERLLDDRIGAVILFPDTGARVWAALEEAAKARGARLPRRSDVHDMSSAVQAAYALTPPGSICLHSPAAPSRGGLFTSYVDRSTQLRDWIIRLSH